MNRIALLYESVKSLNKESYLNICDDFFMFETFKRVNPSKLFKINMCLCCICLQGESRGRINMLSYNMESCTMSINMPGQIVELAFVSDNFHAVCIAMSERFIEGLNIPYNFQTYMELQKCPILKLKKEHMDVLLTYCATIRKLFEVEHPNKCEVIKHLTCALFYGVGCYFHNIAETKHLTNEEVFIQKFFDEVRCHYKKERKVLFYAKQLHLSSGYLSTIIKKYSGRSAAEWIDNYVILEAKTLLRTTNLTIQQISNELNFPSQSFFGKYFKRRIGMSPREYKDAP